MRAFAAVFGREIFERRFAFVVAFAAGFVPLIGSLAYGWRSPDAAEGRVLVALVGATALSAAFAILVGAAVIVGETKEKRISFYFSRPIPSGAIWAGKLLAAIAITLATALLAFAPGWLSGTHQARTLWGLDATPGRTALAALALAVVFVLGSHAVVTVARLRSPWVALDLLLAPALVFLAAVALRFLLRDTFMTFAGPDHGVNVAEIAVAALAVAALLALVFASFAQVAEGRTDARRAHGAFSAVFFGITGIAVALVGGYSAWCASAEWTDLAEIAGSVETAPRGPWVLAGGPLRARRGSGTFLFDPSSGRSLRVRGYDTVFSQDGTHAAWGERRFGYSGWSGKADLVVADLVTGRVAETGLERESWWSSLALSPTGRRLAVRDGRSIAVFDLSTPSNPRQIAAFALTTERRGFAFVDEDTLRVFPRRLSVKRADLIESQLEITELSLVSKKSFVTGRFNPETVPFLRLSPDARFFVGSRRLTEDYLGEQVLTLHDGRTGALLTTLATGLHGPQALFLTGGRFVVAGRTDGSARLLLFESEGGPAAPARTIDLGPATRLALGGEIAPGKIVVALNASDKDEDAMRRGWRAFTFDFVSGAQTPLPEGAVPVSRFGFWYSPVLPPAEAGSPASSLFLDADGRLVRLDPATGARTVLLGKGK